MLGEPRSESPFDRHRLFDRGCVACTSKEEKFRAGDHGGHVFGEGVWREGVALGGNDERGDRDAGQKVFGRVLTCVAEHREKDPWLHGRDMRHVPTKVFFSQCERIDFSRESCDSKRQARWNPTPQRARDALIFRDHIDHGGQDLLEHVTAVKRGGDLPIRATKQDQPTDSIGGQSIGFEANLRAHRVSSENRGFDVGGVHHREKIAGMGGQIDACCIARQAAASVGSVVPVHDTMSFGQMRLEIFPGKSVATDSIVQDERRCAAGSFELLRGQDAHRQCAMSTDGSLGCPLRRAFGDDARR